jgi:hypothetical protein
MNDISNAVSHSDQSVLNSYRKLKSWQPQLNNHLKKYCELYERNSEFRVSFLECLLNDYEGDDSLCEIEKELLFLQFFTKCMTNPSEKSKSCEVTTMGPSGNSIILSVLMESEDYEYYYVISVTFINGNDIFKDRKQYSRLLVHFEFIGHAARSF